MSVTVVEGTLMAGTILKTGWMLLVKRLSGREDRYYGSYTCKNSNGSVGSQRVVDVGRIYPQWHTLG